MFEVTQRSSSRRARAKLGAVLIMVVAMGALGMGLAHAAPPFTISIDSVGVNVLTVTLSGTADSPSNATHHIDIDWGDSSTDTIPLADGGAPWSWGPIDHTYAAAGPYTITTTLIHSQETGNDNGTATDSAVVEVPGVDPCVENPQAAECNPSDDGTVDGNVDGSVDGTTDGTTDGSVETPPPAEVTQVLGKVHKKPLAKTANETTAILWTGMILLMFGATIRFCAVTPGETAVVTEGTTEDLVAKSLELVTRLVRPRN